MGVGVNLRSVISWTVQGNVSEYLPGGRGKTRGFKEDHNLSSLRSVKLIHFLCRAPLAAGFSLPPCFP